CCYYAGSGTACNGTTCEPAATTFAAFYIGSAGAAGATDRLLGNESVPFSFHGSGTDYCAEGGVLPASAGFTHAIVWQTDGGAAPQTFVWSSGAWVGQSYAVTVGFNAATNTPEFGIALASLGLTSGATVTMTGTVFADVSAAAEGASRGSSELFRWPNGGDYCNFNSYFSANLASCISPVTQSAATIQNGGSGGFGCDD
ncbi:MAG: hypothetical protein ACRELB_19975, partial [Polyangiaceae bacterium]